MLQNTKFVLSFFSATFYLCKIARGFFGCLKVLGNVYQYQFDCGILKMVGPKKQDFWPKINILKGNHCILRIQGTLVSQKLGMILKNKVVQKLKLEKKCFLQMYLIY